MDIKKLQERIANDQYIDELIAQYMDLVKDIYFYVECRRDKIADFILKEVKGKKIQVEDWWLNINTPFQLYKLGINNDWIIEDE